MGVALNVAGPANPQGVLADARKALYRAKAQGPGSTEMFDLKVHERAVARLQLEARLRAAVETLLDGKPMDEQRLAQEIALLADRLDVNEEMVRLRTHLDAADAALATSEPIGRTLGFLAQEMLREINTIGSKANDAEIAQRVIVMKGALEKFREQLENLE